MHSADIQWNLRIKTVNGQGIVVLILGSLILKENNIGLCALDDIHYTKIVKGI